MPTKLNHFEKLQKMKIQSIVIEQLFDTFNYTIEYPSKENILILTGPNGSGKTLVLNIIFHFFTSDYDFFKSLVFKTIKITFDDGLSFLLKKSEKENLILHSPWTSQEAHITSNFFYQKIRFEKNNQGVYLIEANRLIQTFNLSKKREESTYTIKNNATKLQKIIQQKIEESFQFFQVLDNTYPDRLIAEKKKISAQEYNERFEALNAKQAKLATYDLYQANLKNLEYSAEDAKALLVYLDDLEKKLGIFDLLLIQLDLFTEIINKRRFTYKSIHIDREKGFYFKTDKGEILELYQLSSGEQQEVILLFDLIFNAKAGSVVLIDEPEISLHVTWQKDFLNDLLKIIKIQNFQVFIATHSPSIINDRWDLVCNLASADQKKVV